MASKWGEHVGSTSHTTALRNEVLQTALEEVAAALEVFDDENKPVTKSESASAQAG